MLWCRHAVGAEVDPRIYPRPLPALAQPSGLDEVRADRQRLKARTLAHGRLE
jgi:hypothetical protein